MICVCDVGKGKTDQSIVIWIGGDGILFAICYYTVKKKSNVFQLIELNIRLSYPTSNNQIQYVCYAMAHIDYISFKWDIQTLGLVCTVHDYENWYKNS